MDYKVITQKILDIHTTEGFDEIDFTDHLEDFFHLKLEEKMQVTQEHIIEITYFIFQEKSGVIKIETSEIENDPTYYDKKREEVDDQEEGAREISNDNELTPIEVIIGGEKDILLYQLLSKFDELRDDFEEIIQGIDTKKESTSETVLLIDKTLTAYEALIQKITGKKETIFEIKNLLNTYLREYAAEIHRKEEPSDIKQEFPEAKVIRLPPFLKK
ncbi:MAG: hypothetical protein KBC69_00630 [Candidatus Magasanikbacteria bacterium]|nr:hypothetical protein [Candidatus Magasanikbacteria bacterium]